jgi:hypothetical protein
MLLTLVLAVANSWSATHPAVMSARPNLSVAPVTGQIDAGFTGRLTQLLDANPQVQAIEIESPGGLALEAYEAAREINKRSITVRVRGECASACAYLWASANNRALVEGARIGLHDGRPAREAPKAIAKWVAQRNSRLAYEALSRAGFSDEVIEKARATPPDSMLWLGAEELRSAGVKYLVAPSRWPPVESSVPKKSSKPTPLRGAA